MRHLHHVEATGNQVRSHRTQMRDHGVEVEDVPGRVQHHHGEVEAAPGNAEAHHVGVDGFEGHTLFAGPASGVDAHGRRGVERRDLRSPPAELDGVGRGPGGQLQDPRRPLRASALVPRLDDVDLGADVAVGEGEVVELRLVVEVSVAVHGHDAAWPKYSSAGSPGERSGRRRSESLRFFGLGGESPA